MTVKSGSAPPGVLPPGEDPATDEMALYPVTPEALALSYVEAGRLQDALSVMERATMLRPHDVGLRLARDRIKGTAAHSGVSHPADDFSDDVTIKRSQRAAAAPAFGQPVSAAGTRAVPLDARGAPIKPATLPQRSQADLPSSDTDNEPTSRQRPAPSHGAGVKSGKDSKPRGRS